MTLGVVAALEGPPGRGSVAGVAPEAVASHIYVVRSGDTLWAIASRMAGVGDPRIVVDRIARANGVTAGGLVPGEAIVLPSTP